MLCQSIEFLLDHYAQRFQVLLDSFPNQIVLNVMVLMAVDATGSGHIGPGDVWMARFEIGGNPREASEMISKQRKTAYDVRRSD